MKRPRALAAKLKKADVEINNYVLALEEEILRLQKQNAKFQVKDVSNQAAISSLKKAQPKMVVTVPKESAQAFKDIFGPHGSTEKHKP